MIILAKNAVLWLGAGKGKTGGRKTSHKNAWRSALQARAGRIISCSHAGPRFGKNKGRAERLTQPSSKAGKETNDRSKLSITGQKKKREREKRRGNQSVMGHGKYSLKES